MEIDIISYTDEQYALLGEEQLLQVQEAQLKKNELVRALENTLQRERERLIGNGMILSSIWPMLEAKLRAECEEEVACLRDGLLFYLRFSAKPGEGESAPYLVDYSLSDQERVNIVREYYTSAYTDGEARVEAFKADEVAKLYLGELYKPMYDYFLELV